MFGGKRGTNAFSLYKWNKSGDPSLNTGLLDDVPPETELSKSGVVPSPASESPSRLLNGESLKAEAIADSDLFFERLYSYYCEKGLLSMVVKWVVELLCLGFVMLFTILLTIC